MSGQRGIIDVFVFDSYPTMPRKTNRGCNGNNSVYGVYGDNIDRQCNTGNRGSSSVAETSLADVAGVGERITGRFDVIPAQRAFKTIFGDE